mgnify:CR=1 FL=1|jgi:AraC-like DNA-binding protein
MNLSDLMRYMAEKHGAVVNIEAIHPAFYNRENLKLAPDQYLHHGSYCLYAKLRGDFSICIENKRRSVKAAQDGKIHFGLCPNGVWDLACPALVGGKPAAVVYFGHFQTPERSLTIFPSGRFSGKLPQLDPSKIPELSRAAEFVAEFIRIEVDCFIRGGGLDAKRHDDLFYAENSSRFIDSKYRENITLKELATTLNMNPNYLGALLKRHYGKTFREMLNQRRVEEAKVYLTLHRSRNISKIAILCGFNDSNYFSVVFKRLTGMMPSAWRVLQTARESQIK